MVAAYIIAGVILGFLSPMLSVIITGRPASVTPTVAYMLAFPGGVAGHLLFNLVYT